MMKSGIAATLSVGKFYKRIFQFGNVYIGGGQTASANSSTREKLTFSSEAEERGSTYGTPREIRMGAMSNSGTKRQCRRRYKIL